MSVSATGSAPTLLSIAGTEAQEGPSPASETKKGKRKRSNLGKEMRAHIETAWPDLCKIFSTSSNKPRLNFLRFSPLFLIVYQLADVPRRKEPNRIDQLNTGKPNGGLINRFQAERVLQSILLEGVELKEILSNYDVCETLPPSIVNLLAYIGEKDNWQELLKSSIFDWTHPGVDEIKKHSARCFKAVMIVNFLKGINKINIHFLYKLERLMDSFKKYLDPSNNMSTECNTYSNKPGETEATLEKFELVEKTHEQLNGLVTMFRKHRDHSSTLAIAQSCEKVGDEGDKDPLKEGIAIRQFNTNNALARLFSEELNLFDRVNCAWSAIASSFDLGAEVESSNAVDVLGMKTCELFALAEEISIAEAMNRFVGDPPLKEGEFVYCNSLDGTKRALPYSFVQRLTRFYRNHRAIFHTYNRLEHGLCISRFFSHFEAEVSNTFSTSFLQELDIDRLVAQIEGKRRATLSPVAKPALPLQESPLISPSSTPDLQEETPSWQGLRDAIGQLFGSAKKTKHAADAATHYQSLLSLCEKDTLSVYDLFGILLLSGISAENALKSHLEKKNPNEPLDVHDLSYLFCRSLEKGGITNGRKLSRSICALSGIEIYLRLAGSDRQKKGPPQVLKYPHLPMNRLVKRLAASLYQEGQETSEDLSPFIQDMLRYGALAPLKILNPNIELITPLPCIDLQITTPIEEPFDNAGNNISMLNALRGYFKRQAQWQDGNYKRKGVYFLLFLYFNYFYLERSVMKTLRVKGGLGKNYYKHNLVGVIQDMNFGALLKELTEEQKRFLNHGPQILQLVRYPHHFADHRNKIAQSLLPLLGTEPATPKQVEEALRIIEEVYEETNTTLKQISASRGAL